MQVRCTAVSRVSDGSYDFTLADRAPLAGADIFEVRIACDIAVLVVDDDRVSQFVFLAGKFHNATTRRKTGSPDWAEKSVPRWSSISLNFLLTIPTTGITLGMCSKRTLSS